MAGEFKKILFFADGAKGELSALRRAYSLAEHHSASLTVIAVVEAVSTNDPKLTASMNKLQQTLIKDRSIAVDKLIADIGNGNHHVEIHKQVVAGKPYVEVIKAAMAEHCDLVVKSVNSPGLLRGIFGNNDTRLLHLCPCPVLILRPSRRKQLRSILVAVDPHADGDGASALNQQLLAEGAVIAEREAGELHVLHVQEKLPASTSMPAAQLKKLEAARFEQADLLVSEMIAGMPSPPVKHLLKGDPHKTIAGFVSKQEVDLLIMGSVARSGVPGLIVGNTAERILEHVNCSVLVLKPEGWQTPLI